MERGGRADRDGGERARDAAKRADGDRSEGDRAERGRGEGGRVDPAEVWRGLAELLPWLERRLAARCRDAAEVDDVVQETVVRAARYRRSLTDLERLRPWAWRIARNVLADRAGRERPPRRVAPSATRLDLLPAPEPEGDDAPFRLGGWVLEREEALAHLRSALGRLREDDRRMLVTYYAGRRSGRATAEACGVPAEGLKVRLFRARRRLLRELRRGVGLRGAARADGGAGSEAVA